MGPSHQMHDPRIGQRGQNQRQMQIVHRQLVDESGVLLACARSFAGTCRQWRGDLALAAASKSSAENRRRSTCLEMRRVARPNCCNSPAECTCEWLVITRSISVVPVRGWPNTKIGESSGLPVGCSANHAALKLANQFKHSHLCSLVELDGLCRAAAPAEKASKAPTQSCRSSHSLPMA